MIAGAVDRCLRVALWSLRALVMVTGALVVGGELSVALGVLV